MVAEFPNALELNDKGELVERGTKDGESEFAAMGRGILGYHEQYWEAIKNDTNPKELDSEKLKFLKEKYKEGKIKSLVDVFTWGNKKGREIHEKYQAEDKAPVTKPEGKSDVVVDKASNVGVVEGSGGVGGDKITFKKPESNGEWGKVDKDNQDKLGEILNAKLDRNDIIIDGKNIGTVTVGRREGEGNFVQNIRLENENIGKGIGNKVYLKLNEQSLEETGLPLQSSVFKDMGANSIKFWE